MVRAAVAAGLIVALSAPLRADCTFQVNDLPEAAPIVWTPAQRALYQATSDAVSPQARVISIGMSNSRSVFQGFYRAMRKDSTVVPDLDDRFVRGAQGGKALTEWAETEGPWDKLFTRHMPKKGATRQNVEIALAMLTLRGDVNDPIAAHVDEFVAKFRVVLQRLEDEFPNLRQIVILENYSGRYDVGQDKTPEPHGWAKQAALQQIQDTWAGRVPVFAMSLWSGDGPRWDGFYLACGDVKPAGVHLDGRAASNKVGGHLLEMFRAVGGWMFPAGE